MLRRLLTLLLVLSWSSSMAMGGAWPRAKGATFLSAAVHIEGPDDFGLYRQNFSFYAEHGLTERLTFGLDLYGDTQRMSKAIGFLRWPLGPASRELKLALELGAGQVEDAAALRPGLAIGRGFKLGGHYGWLNADTRAVLGKGGDGASYEGDYTAGLSLGDRVKLIAQIQAGVPAQGRAYLRLAPSVVLRTRPGTHLELGMTEPVSGGGDRKLKLGFWLEF